VAYGKVYETGKLVYGSEKFAAAAYAIIIRDIPDATVIRHSPDIWLRYGRPGPLLGLHSRGTEGVRATRKKDEAPAHASDLRRFARHPDLAR
jgi:hypothetical protein